MEIEINSLAEYIDKVLQNTSDVYEIIYRGQASCKFDLISSIGRIKDYSVEVEKKLFVEFRKRYIQFTSNIINTDLGLLIMAQHYGLPTRLLDWTFNPLVALYFACEKEDDIDGKVYSIPLNTSYDLEELGDLTLSIDKILMTEKCKYIVPNYTEARYSNQKSLFLLCASPHRKFTFADTKTVYLIKHQAKQSILKQLSVLGIDKTFIFPRLDNVSKDIMYKNNIKFKKIEK